jgi:hypothetical protein
VSVSQSISEIVIMSRERERKGPGHKVKDRLKRTWMEKGKEQAKMVCVNKTQSVCERDRENNQVARIRMQDSEK